MDQQETLIKLKDTTDRRMVISDFLDKGGDKIIMEVLSQHLSQLNNLMISSKGDDLKTLAENVKHSQVFTLLLLEAFKKLVGVDK